MDREVKFIDKLFSIIPGGIFGLMSIITILIGYTLAYLYFPGYSIFNNMVSELGIGPGGIFFNIGVIISGVIIIPFYIELAKSFQGDKIKEKTRKLAINSSIISCCTYVIVGVFPTIESNIIFYYTHGISAVICVISGLIYLISFSILMFKAENYKKIQAYHGFIVAGSYALFLLIWIPIVEWILTLCILSWITANSIYIIYKRY